MKPKTIKKQTIKKIETLKSLKPKIQIRVWCHNLKGGDDFYYVFEYINDALAFIEHNHDLIRKDKTTELAEDFPLIAIRTGKGILSEWEFNFFRK